MRPLSSWPTPLYAGIVTAVFLGSAGAVYLFLARTPAPRPHVEPAQIVPRASQPVHTVIGRSVEGRTIDAYTFAHNEPAPSSRENSLVEPEQRATRGLFREKLGAGEEVKHIIFVGGIHGGYEWNSVALAYKALDYLTKNPTRISPDTQVTIIPNLNPDGVFKVTALEGPFTAEEVSGTSEKEPGRFNARSVDLNRNFACAWQKDSTWKGQKVSAGTQAFSEPESQALKRFVEKELAVYAPRELTFVFWHSQANAVYASQCGEGVLPATTSLMRRYADASGYKAVAIFDAYPVTGAAEDWLASLTIPAITVELSSHTSLDWDKNLAGITALIQ